KMAKSNDDEDDLDMEPRQAEEEEVDQTPFIDHNTFMLGFQSGSSTPLLDKIRWSYSIMCMTRKSGETGTKSSSFQLTQGDLEGSNIRFGPAKYSMHIPNSRICLSALYDFAKTAFPEFGALSEDNRGLCISGCIPSIIFLDAVYRGAHYFPNDLDTYFESYTTILDKESIQTFVDDCPF
ncbi:hypothetical protein PENTCL1PPCAC_7696, partial [Pristionchus entomophagus]